MYEKEPKVIIRNKDYGTTKRLVVKSRLDIVEEFMNWKIVLGEQRGKKKIWSRFKSNLEWEGPKYAS